MEKNRIELTGSIHKLFRIQTRTGKPMVKLLLKVGNEGTFWVMGFGNIAQALQGCREGEDIAIAGTCKMNNWKSDDGAWHNEFNATAWSIEIGGKRIDYQKEQSDQDRTPEPPPVDQYGPENFDYQGGPF